MVFSCLAVLSSGNASGQVQSAIQAGNRDAGGLSRSADHDARLMEMDIWLRRLAGKFRITGDYSLTRWYEPPCETAKKRASAGVVVLCDSADDPPLPAPLVLQGVGDCTSLGTGPGMHCILGFSGTPTTEQAQVFQTLPRMTLYGLDPDAEGIRYMQIDGKGTPEGGLGELQSDTVTFKIKCPLTPVPTIETLTCSRLVKITAEADSKFIHIWTQTDQRHRSSAGGSVLEGPIVFEVRLERVSQQDGPL